MPKASIAASALDASVTQGNRRGRSWKTIPQTNWHKEEKKCDCNTEPLTHVKKEHPSTPLTTKIINQLNESPIAKKMILVFYSFCLSLPRVPCFLFSAPRPLFPTTRRHLQFHNSAFPTSPSQDQHITLATPTTRHIAHMASYPFSMSNNTPTRQQIKMFCSCCCSFCVDICLSLGQWLISDNEN